VRCTCGFSDDPTNIRYAKIERGRLQCPYCAGQIACETAALPKLRCSAEAFALIAPLARRRRQESFWVFYLDSRNQVVGKHREVCRGGLTACVVPTREVFGEAYVKRAAAIVVAHNHPSGDPTPSPEDETLTKRLVETGRLMGIPVLDHLIIGKDSYFSFRDTGGI
jgi:DNA repair protein RadC